MPPKKKARTDNYTPRITRSRARRALAGVAHPEDVPNNPEAPLESCAQGSGEPAQKVVRIRRGSLQQLPEVAIEIQNMIFGDLEPRDLFNLSRTCKRFHAHFLSKNTEPLWKAVMQNAPDLPERPPWLSIPAYVHLLYSQFCHNCGAPNIRKIQFATFMRLCSTCVQKLTVWYKNAFDTMLTARERKSWLFATFHFNDRFPRRSFFFKILTRPMISKNKNPTKNRVLKEHVMLFVKGFRAAKNPNKDRFHEAVVKVFQTIRKDHVARLPYANDIQDWMEEQDDERKLDLETARTQRFELIKARLWEDGWGKELDFIGAKGIEAMSKLPVVRQSSKLTEGGEKVLAALDKFLHDARTRRLDVEMKAVLRPRMKDLEEAIIAHYLKIPRTPKMDCRPQAIDFAFLPECRALLELPASRVVTDEDFASIVPALAAQWEADRRDELVKYLRPHLGKIADDVDPLSLAIAVFEHEYGDGQPSLCMLYYPAVLSHDSCGIGSLRKRDATLDELVAADVYTRGVMTLYWTDGFFNDLKAGKTRYQAPRVQVPFRADRLFQFKKAGRAVTPVARMRKIVAALGLDPARATFDELQKHDGALRCDTCEKEDPKDAVMALMWCAAYDHATLVHPEGHPKWRRASEKDMKKVRAHLNHLPPLGNGVSWTCALCTEFVGRPETIPEHLSEVHQVRDYKKAIRDGTIYISPGRERWHSGGEEIILRKGAPKGRR
ncbi:hypothetical protein C8Q79DRAFT_918678 [Trametes meyenii]|nr:hypothetical protein C8Q79DRAFT_918678 [Trametes meyenii]